MRAAEAADVLRHPERHEPQFEQFRPCVLKPGGGFDDAVLVPAADAVGRPVQRSGHFVTEPDALRDHLIAVFLGEVAEQLGCEDLLDLEVLIEGELERAAVALEGIDGGVGHGLDG